MRGPGVRNGSPRLAANHDFGLSLASVRRFAAMYLQNSKDLPQGMPNRDREHENDAGEEVPVEMLHSEVRFPLVSSGEPS